MQNWTISSAGEVMFHDFPFVDGMLQSFSYENDALTVRSLRKDTRLICSLTCNLVRRLDLYMSSDEVFSDLYCTSFREHDLLTRSEVLFSHYGAADRALMVRRLFRDNHESLMFIAISGNLGGRCEAVFAELETHVFHQ